MGLSINNSSGELPKAREARFLDPLTTRKTHSVYSRCLRAHDYESHGIYTVNALFISSDP